MCLLNARVFLWREDGSFFWACWRRVGQFLSPGWADRVRESLPCSSFFVGLLLETSGGDLLTFSAHMPHLGHPEPQRLEAWTSLHLSLTDLVFEATEFGVTGMLLAWMMKLGILSSLDFFRLAWAASWWATSSRQHCPQHLQGIWHLVQWARVWPPLYESCSPQRWSGSTAYGVLGNRRPSRSNHQNHLALNAMAYPSLGQSSRSWDWHGTWGALKVEGTIQSFYDRSIL